MKTIGLIGGMSWESSLEYYRIINETVENRLGGFHSAKCLMYSVDFAEIESLMARGRWHDAGQMLADIAKNLENGGADFLVLCTNTLHKVSDTIQAAVRIPFLHIADATAQKVVEQGLTKIALLGTQITMEDAFYKGILTQKYGLNVIIPQASERDIVHRVIFDELCLGKILPESRAKYMAIMDRLADQGAQGIILGCTEIGLLIGEHYTRVPLFDTALIHAIAAVEYALCLGSETGC